MPSTPLSRRTQGASAGLSVLALLITSCLGNGTMNTTVDPDDPSGPPESVDPTDPAVPVGTLGPIVPGTAPLRRLTHVQYDNTVHDLLGDTTSPGRRFPPDQRRSGLFDNDADILNISPLLIEAYADAAHALAVEAIKHLDVLVPTVTLPLTTDAQARTVIKSIGGRAFRRPLLDAELAALMDVYAANKTPGPINGVSAVLEVLLQSPQFLYRPEPPTPGAGIARLDGAAIATRLSYFLWDTTPDDALLAAAAAGALANDAEVLKQAQRLLADPRAHQVVARFHAQWLRLDDVSRIHKNETLFPQLTPKLLEDFRAETEAYLEDAFWVRGNPGALFEGSRTFATPALASHYGLAAPASGTFGPVELPAASGRSGLLTQGSLLSLLSLQDQTSPTQRGRFVRERLLCRPLPPPPPDVNTNVPPPDPSVPTRTHSIMHMQNAACSGCHALMDPIGFGLEGFDAIGRARRDDGGAPVDVSGEVMGGTDVDGRFVGAVELAHKLASSQHVRDCVATQWFRYAFGHVEREADVPALTALRQHLSDEQDLRSLLLQVTTSVPFLYSSNPEATP